MENEKTVIDFTGMSTSQVYKEVRRRLTEDILEFMAQKYERAVRLSNTEVAVLLGFINDEDGFPHDVCGICKAQSKPYYSKDTDDKGNALKREVKESIDFYVECAKADGEVYPSILDSDYEIIYKFDVRSLLEYYRGIFSFSALQTITGINQKQLAHYASGISKPRPQQARKIADGLHKLAAELLTVTV